MFIFRRLCSCFLGDATETVKVTPFTSRSRVHTKVDINQVTIIEDKIRKTTNVRAYSCPICFLYYSNVMYCNACGNCMCIHCLNGMMEKLDSKCQTMECPFCKSNTSEFKDWEQQESKLYFDKSKTNEFLSKTLRLQVDSLKKQTINASEKNEIEQQNQIQSSHINIFNQPNEIVAENQ